MGIHISPLNTTPVSAFDFFIPQSNGYCNTGTGPVRHLQTHSIWRRLSSSQAEELSLFELELRSAIAEKVLGYTDSFLDSTKSRNTSFLIKVNVVELARKIIAESHGSCLTQSPLLKLENVIQFVRLHDCFVRSAVDQPLGQNHISRVLVRTSRDNTSPEISMHPSRIEFEDLVVQVEHGQNFYLRPRYMTTFSASKEAKSSFEITYMTTCGWLKYNEENSCFAGNVPRDKCGPTEILVRSKVVHSFTETNVRYEEMVSAVVVIFVLPELRNSTLPFRSKPKQVRFDDASALSGRVENQDSLGYIPRKEILKPSSCKITSVPQPQIPKLVSVDPVQVLGPKELKNPDPNSVQGCKPYYAQNSFSKQDSEQGSMAIPPSLAEGAEACVVRDLYHEAFRQHGELLKVLKGHLDHEGSRRTSSSSSLQTGPREPCISTHSGDSAVNGILDEQSDAIDPESTTYTCSSRTLGAGLGRGPFKLSRMALPLKSDVLTSHCSGNSSCSELDELDIKNRPTFEVPGRLCPNSILCETSEVDRHFSPLTKGSDNKETEFDNVKGFFKSPLPLRAEGDSSRSANDDDGDDGVSTELANHVGEKAVELSESLHFTSGEDPRDVREMRKGLLQMQMQEMARAMLGYQVDRWSDDAGDDHDDDNDAGSISDSHYQMSDIMESEEESALEQSLRESIGT